ncbi:MAG: tetratricopeptide repeat protein, partial [Opitutales bacterium]
MQAQTEAPREPMARSDPPIVLRLEGEVWRGSADDALRAGLPSVARDMYLRLLETNPALADEPDFVRSLSAAYIDLGQGSEAGALLQAHPSALAWWRLHMALVRLMDGETAQAAALLAPPFDSASLDESLRSWYHLALGMIKARGGDAKAASDEYSKAMDGAPDGLRSQVELLLLRDQLTQGKASNSVVADLRLRLRDLQGQRGGFEAGRLLAIALFQLGRQAEALSVLDDQLRFIGVSEAGTREQLLMLVGFIAGPNTGRGRVALQQVLMNADAPRSLLKNALGMLASASSGENSASFREIIDTVISREPNHPLMDELLLVRSDLSIREGRLEEATQDAQRIIDQFPASGLRHPAMRSLAYLSYVRKPPQYRTSASYLTQLRSELPEGRERAVVGLLIADCFFLNGDYANAASAYEDLRNETVIDPGMVFYQMVLSELKAGRLDDARAAMGSLDSGAGQVDPMHRWRAEWNMIHAMRERGQSADAFARLAALLARGGPNAPPPSLRLRLMWLEAQLSLDAGRPEQTPGRCQAVLDALGAVPDDVLDPAQRVVISSHTLLLKAQALLAVDNEAEASTTLDLLRNQHQDSAAAQNSYLVQARWLVSHERLVEAQRMLVALADRYPGSDQAPVALWEAALASEQRGLEVTYREAISLLDRLVSEYPKSDLVFYARLHQGDILRKLNDFATALLAYEDLVNRFPQHPALYLARMSRADCIISQSVHNPARRIVHGLGNDAVRPAHA